MVWVENLWNMVSIKKTALIQRMGIKVLVLARLEPKSGPGNSIGFQNLLSNSARFTLTN